MAGIYPNSDFIICKGVPLDLGYEHTIYQDSKTAQYNLFHSYQKNGTNSKFHLTAQSYQRLNKGVIRVGIKSDELYDCNYVMFRNTSYTNTDGTAKWFYAFITSVEYINDNCSDITYEIDVMQTWYFDYELGECFVEREHTLTDEIDDNYEPEDVAIGDYLVDHKTTFHYKWSESTTTNRNLWARIYYVPNDNIVTAIVPSGGTSVVLGTEPITDSSMIGYYRNGIFISAAYVEIPLFYDAQNATGMNIAKTVNKIIDENGNIVSIQLVPATPASYSDITFTESDYFDDNVGNTYLPSNHKMYHSPFKKIVITNSQGEQKEYKWEMFRDTTAQNVKQATFGINVAKLPVPELHIYPKQYAQMEQENGLIFNGFPTYAWSEDTFSKWWAQNSTATIMGMVSGTIASYIGLNLTTPPKKKVGDYVGKRTALGVVEDAISFAQQLSVMSNTPDTQNGSFTGNITAISEDRIGFTIYEMSIRPEIARTIDNFFTKFGYACKKLKKLNIRDAAKTNLRPHWNYVKTSNCTCHGNNMNSKDEQKIEEIYNKGITYWLNANEVGNYSLVNYPRG